MPIATENILLVLSKPLPGREEEYDHWYSDIHLVEVLERPGFISARRFRLEGGIDVEGFGRPEQTYLALYEIEGDPAEAYASISREISSGQLAVTEAIDPAVVTAGFTAITDTMTEAQAAAQSGASA